MNSKRSGPSHFDPGATHRTRILSRFLYCPVRYPSYKELAVSISNSATSAVSFVVRLFSSLIFFFFSSTESELADLPIQFALLTANYCEQYSMNDYTGETFGNPYPKKNRCGPAGCQSLRSVISDP